MAKAANKRVRTVGSIANELIKKSREAALSAVQIFNSPSITFKSETFIVLMVIAWTYLLHAHYRKKGVEYRYHKIAGARRIFERTGQGAFRYWDLAQCLKIGDSPVKESSATNLAFLIGLRHEIEHQMTTRLDEQLSARFQACCLNYNDLVKKLFGDAHGIDKHLSFSLQFSSIDTEQVKTLDDAKGLPAHIRAYINAFDAKLTEDVFNDPRFAYRVLFVPKSVNKKGQADKVIEFIKSDSDLAKDVNQHYAVIKETEKTKYLPSQIIELIKDKGFKSFTMHDHTTLWKKENAKDLKKHFGTSVAGHWYWYDSWLEYVTNHCQHQPELKQQ
ncbi:DUF3644 domain-containing protein [Caballeronia sp. DA-9]|uniref:DUF3644 domain-containing protein n=1 Tax=Caballeronia sp. DA-9 TaxID=3436237 RepID=UPI003F6756CC